MESNGASAGECLKAKSRVIGFLPDWPRRHLAHSETGILPALISVLQASLEKHSLSLSLLRNKV